MGRKGNETLCNDKSAQNVIYNYFSIPSNFSFPESINLNVLLYLLITTSSRPNEWKLYTNIYLRSPETCMDENIWTVPPESLTESTKLTYFCRSVISLFLQNIMLLNKQPCKIDNLLFLLCKCWQYDESSLSQTFYLYNLNPKENKNCMKCLLNFMHAQIKSSLQICFTNLISYMHRTVQRNSSQNG